MPSSSAADRAMRPRWSATSSAGTPASRPTRAGSTVTNPNRPCELNEPLEDARHALHQLDRGRPLLAQRDGDLADHASHPLRADDQLAGEEIALDAARAHHLHEAVAPERLEAV